VDSRVIRCAVRVYPSFLSTHLTHDSSAEVNNPMDDLDTAAGCDNVRRERRLEQEEQEMRSKGERYTDDLAMQETRRLVLQSDDEDGETDGEGYYDEHEHDDGYSDAGSDASSFLVFKRPGGARNWAFSVVGVILTRRRAFTMIGLATAVLLAYSLFASSAPLDPRQQGIATTSPPWYPTRWCIPSILLPPKGHP
jgi:hypothetical protein